MCDSTSDFKNKIRVKCTKDMRAVLIFDDEGHINQIDINPFFFFLLHSSPQESKSFHPHGGLAASLILTQIGNKTKPEYLALLVIPPSSWWLRISQLWLKEAELSPVATVDHLILFDISH